MSKKLFWIVSCGVVLLTAGLDAKVYSRREAMETLARGLIANLGEKLKNAAVVDFINLDGQVSMFGKHIAEEMSTRLAKWGDFTIVERALIDKAIAEQKYSLSDFVDLTKAASLGKLVGAQGIVIGTITELEKTFQVNARIIHTETGEVLSTSGVEVKKDVDTIKLASEIITIPKPEKKEEKKPEPEVVKEPEPKPEPKVEKPVVKEEPKEKIFYYEDFSTVEEGDIPKGWLGGEKLMVKKEGREKFLTPFEKGVHRFSVDNIVFPKDFIFEWIINCGRSGYHDQQHAVTIGDVKIAICYEHGLWTYCSRMNETAAEHEDIRGKTVKVSLKKIGAVFRLFIDDKQILMARYPEFKPPSRFIFETGTIFRFYSIKGIDLTEKTEEK